MTVFTTQCVKTTSHTLLFGIFGKKVQQSVICRESFTNFKIIITKCEKISLQSMKGITNRGNLLQNITGIRECDKRLLHTVTGTTQSDKYCNVRLNNDHKN